MQGKVTLEDHFATEATLGDSQAFGAHVWQELRYRLLDFQDQRLRLMDESGIEIMVASLNAPAIQAIPDVKEAAATARQANDVLAAEVAKRPDRFVGVAALAMQDPEIATQELERCVKELGFKGALVNGFSQVGEPDTAVYYDLPQYRPFWSDGRAPRRSVLSASAQSVAGQHPGLRRASVAARAYLGLRGRDFRARAAADRQRAVRQLPEAADHPRPSRAKACRTICGASTIATTG